MKTRTKKVLIATVTLTALYIYAYFLYLAVTGDARVADGKILGGDLTIVESTFTAISISGNFVLWLGAVWYAFRQGDKGWAAAIFFLWVPLALIYWLLMFRRWDREGDDFFANAEALTAHRLAKASRSIDSSS